MKELEDIFDEKIDDKEQEDYKHFNNFQHKQNNHSKENDKEKEKNIQKEKQLKTKEKKNFIIQDRILKKKIENEKNKERLYKLSSIENFFVSIINKITFFRENKMIYQIYILYIFLFIIFTVSLVYMKYTIVTRAFDNYLEQNYYPFIEDEVIKSQNNIKMKCDEKNNKNIISTLDEEMLFMEIFSKELINNKILTKNIIKFNDNEGQDEGQGQGDGNGEGQGDGNGEGQGQGDNEGQGQGDDEGQGDGGNKESYEDYLGVNFRISDDLKNLINKGINDVKNYNLKNLIIYNYNFIPIIYQYMKSLGLNMVNFYFIANSPDCNVPNPNVNNLFFKYPLEQNNFGVDIEPGNDKIYDYLVDPFISCNSGFDFTDNPDLAKQIEEKNWYHKLYGTTEEKGKEINFRLLQIMKINQINKRKDYYIAFDKFNFKLKDSNDDINFLFAIRITKSDIIYPFIQFNEYNDTLSYDFLSIYNFDLNDGVNSLNNWEKMDDIFQKDYDIDDGKNIIFKNPKFMENLGYFGLQNKNIENNENEDKEEDKDEDNNNLRILKKEKEKENEVFDNKIPMDNTILIKYNEINDIKNKYEYNYYYDADIIYYKLIYFLNQFFQYKKYHPNYLTSEESEESQNEENNLQISNPCSISDLDEYYDSIKSKFDYDCIYDFCFFHNCEPHDELFIKRNNLNFPNCYCLPLFCRDQNTKKNSQFEKLIKEKLNIEDDNFDISYTGKYNYYMFELESPFSKINEFFDREKFSFRCKIDFDKKNADSNKSFSANIYESKYNNDNIFLMYLYNLENLNNITNDLDNNNSNFILSVTYIYVALCFILGALIFIYVHFLCNKLITKMNKVKNIRKSIISNVNDNLNNDNSNENIINNKEQKENINNNIIGQKDSTELFVKDKPENNNNINIKNNENEILIKDNDEKNKDKTKSGNKKENSEEDDELDELIKLINSNLSVFKIEFNLNEESKDNLSNIKRQYEEIIQVNKLKNKLLLKEKSKSFSLNINNMNNSSTNSEENENKKKKEKIEDLSVNIFCELLSLSNPKIDFSDIKTNFYYKEIKDNSLYGLKNVLDNKSEGNNVENIDIINIEKLQNALEHYAENIHNYWKNYYEIQKNKDEI